MTVSGFIDAGFDEAAEEIEWSLTTNVGDTSGFVFLDGNNNLVQVDSYLRTTDEEHK